MALSNSTDRFNGVIAAQAIKTPCQAVAIANITLSGEQTVNGVAVVADDRVLVIAQTSALDNGIYDVSTSAWTRAADFDGNRDIVSGTFVTIATATVGRNPYYQVTTANPITIGTTAINFTLADGANVSYALTAAETSAGLTDSDIDDSFVPYNVLRYGVNTTPGVTNMSTAFKNAIQAAIKAAVADLGTVLRGSPEVKIPAGTYLVDTNTFGAYTETDVRTLQIVGEGHSNSIVVLSEDGALGVYTAASKILFPVFKDIGFYGDSLLDTASNDGSNPVSANRKMINSSASSGVQGFRFYSCQFARFGEQFLFQGGNNESENKWFGCRHVRNGDFLVLDNDKSLNHDIDKCEHETYSGSLVRIKSGGGGANIRFDGGSVIPFDEGSIRYVVEVNAGSAASEQPTVQFNGTKFEVRFDRNGLVSTTALTHSWVQFDNCGFLASNGAGGTKRWVDIGSYSRVHFNDCSFAETGTAATNVWYMKGGTQVGEIGTLQFDGCKGVPLPTEVTLGTESSNLHGSAIAKNSITSNVAASSEDTAALNWTIGDSWYKRSNLTKNSPIIHRTPLMGPFAPANALQSETNVLAPNSVILRVVGFIFPQGSATDAITYSLDDSRAAATDATGDTDGSTAVITGMTDTSDFEAGDFVTVSAGFHSATFPFEILLLTSTTMTLSANSNSMQTNVTVAATAVNLFTVVVADQKIGAHFDKTPSDFTAFYQARIGTTVNARTLVFSASADAGHQNGRGVGFIEYM